MSRKAYREKQFIAPFTGGDALARVETAKITARPRYGGTWFAGLHWSDVDRRHLAVLCAAGADAEKSADALGRPPTALASYAKDAGLSLPQSWSRLIRTYKPRPRSPGIVLAYPYISTKGRPEHVALMEVNDLVPHGGMSSWVRADVCQNVLLALYEGDVTLDVLKQHAGDARYFVKNFHNAGQDWREVTLTPYDSDDARSYDEMAAGWGGLDKIDRYVPAPQIEYVFAKEAARVHRALGRQGHYHPFSETKRMLEADLP